ncbi:MAG: hypothetical protein PHF88_01785 [Candidatus Pacebacteria bacterium]|nr:hypothetical protein [Candidatus Paceibacterota bacterium]
MANFEVTDDSFSFKIESKWYNKTKKLLNSLRKEEYSVFVSYTSYVEIDDDFPRTMSFEIKSLKKENYTMRFRLDLCDDVSTNLLRKVVAFYRLTRKQNVVIEATANDGRITFKVILPENVRPSS